MAANIAAEGPPLPGAAFVDALALLLLCAEVAPSMIMVEEPPPAPAPLEVADEVIVIPELMSVGIDMAGSIEVDDMVIPGGIDIAVSIEVVDIDMSGMDICATQLLASRRTGVMIVANNMVDDCVGLCCRLLTGGLARCKCWATM